MTGPVLCENRTGIYTQSRWGWSRVLAIKARAAPDGTATKANWLDPLPGIVTETILQAEAKEQHEA